MRARCPRLCFVALFALSSAACDESDDETPGSANLRAINASPGSPDLDLYFEGAPAPFARDLAYGAPTVLFNVAPSPKQIEVRIADEPATTTPLFTTSGFSSAENGEYILIAAGDVASTDPATSLRLLTLTDEFDAAPAGMTRVRVVNASSDAPPIDVDVQEEGDGEVEVQGLERFASSPGTGFDVPAGTLLPVAVSSGSAALTLFQTPRFGSGTTNFWIMTGLLDALPREPVAFSLLSLQTNGFATLTAQDPFVYLFHALPDTGALDVFFGELEVASEVSFGEIASIQLPAGAQTLDFFAAQPGASPRPATAPLASATTPELTTAQELLAVATGELSASPPTFGLVTVVEQFALDDPENVLVCAVNAAIDSPALDLGVLQAPGEMAEPPLVTDLSFSESGDPTGVIVPSAETEFGLAETGSTDAQAEFTIESEPGDRSFLIAAGTFDTGMDAVQMFVVDTTVRPWTVTRAPAE